MLYAASARPRMFAPVACEQWTGTLKVPAGHYRTSYTKLSKEKANSQRLQTLSDRSFLRAMVLSRLAVRAACSHSPTKTNCASPKSSSHCLRSLRSCECWNANRAEQTRRHGRISRRGLRAESLVPNS